jgi:ATP-dependent RNA helicase MSS116
MFRFAQVAIRMSSVPRAGRGAGRSVRRNNARPYHASLTRNGPATAAAVKPAEPQLASSVEIPATNDQRRHFSNQTFAEAPISKASKAGIKHKYLSDVQAATLSLGLAGKDLLVQAKTGTGKTMAFLLPSVERLATVSPPPRQGQVSILILSPTRELALQIEEEAKTLLTCHSFRAQHAIGGTSITAEQHRMRNERCDILIATPGRLLDHLENGDVRSRLANVQCLILDEADRLLDQGFMNDLQKIFTFLPPRTQVPRQAMLFSATMSAEVKQVVGKALSGDYQFVSTLTEEEANTHEHVPQSVISAPLSDTLATTLAVVREDKATHGAASKIMIFCPTARSTGLAADVFRKIKGLPPVLEIHSRKSQSQRSKAAEAFKNAKNAILFSSDVAARGMDFPG